MTIKPAAHTFPRDFHGPTTFTYNLTDSSYSISPATAVVTINVDPAALMAPANYSYNGEFNKPFTPGQDHTLLEQIFSSNVEANLTVTGITKMPPNEQGSLTIESNGNFTFVPKDGWYGESTG